MSDEMGTTTTVPTESEPRLAAAEQVKHTPGPWEVGYGALNVWATDHKGNFPVCDIRGWGHFTGKGHGALGLPEEQGADIQAANARLIAAAPDMLAALKAFISETLGKNPHIKVETTSLAMAAIAKAEGRAP